MIMTFFEFVKSLSAVIIVIPPAVFIFSVTLLGAAVERLHNEEKAEMEKDDASTKEEINKLDDKIKAIRTTNKNGDTGDLLINLDALKKHKKESDRRIKKIKNKYSSIDLVNTLIYPFFCFVGAMFQAHIGITLLTKSYSPILIIVSFFTVVIFLFIGFIKIYKALNLVQEISVNKKENEYFDRLKDTIKIAILEDKEGSKSEVVIKFVDKSFPLNINTATELEMPFRVKLAKGSILNNVSVWFFIPDGLDLIKPSEKEGWRQGGDYDPPNIRTVRIVVGNISVGPYTPRSLKIKTTTEKGNYKIKYKIYADGYVGTEQFIELIVI